MKLITLASYLLILVMLVKAVMRGEIPVGAFIAVFNSLSTLYDFMEELICYHVGHMAQGMGKVNNFMDFLEMESQDGTQEAQLAFHNIRLSKVSFSYPEARTEALSDISLEIKKGETLAVVGENGSGKQRWSGCSPVYICLIRAVWRLTDRIWQSLKDGISMRKPRWYFRNSRSTAFLLRIILS